MSTVIHATEAAELLGIVPALAGFTPRRSIVMLPFQGARTNGAMRVDLPQPDAAPESFAKAALHALLQVSGIDATTIIVYTDNPPQSVPDGILLPHLSVAEALIDLSGQAGLRVVNALCVTPDGWSDYLEEDPAIRSLDDIPTFPEIPGLGDLSGDQCSGAALPTSDLTERERVGRALGEIEQAAEHRRRGGRQQVRSESPMALAVTDVIFDDLPAFAEGLVVRPSHRDEYRCAGLLWCLSRPMLRDVILLQWATDQEFGVRVLDTQIAYMDSRTPVPEEIGGVFLGRGPRPDADRVSCALEVVRLAAARAPRHAKAGALTAAAWLAWALGRSSHAAKYVEEALLIEPEHGLATLISSMLSAALLPEWALRRA